MESQTRIKRKIRELAKDYLRKGYTVRAKGEIEGLPAALTEYTPDLWLQKAEKNVWVVVETSETLAASPELTPLAEILQALPNWELEFVLTNPRKQR